MMVLVIFSVIIILYTLLILLFWLGWEQATPCAVADTGPIPVTLVIAVRNEAKNITALLQDIERQTYPQELLQVVIVDDHSTDQTAALVEKFAGQTTLPIELTGLAATQGKKKAMACGVGRARHELILTTDGDCRLPETWVARLTACFSEEKTQLVSGPVRLRPQQTFWQRLQAIEFSSLISAGAATLSLGWPTMANAANMAFRKRAYQAVQGQQDKAVSSGDDVFLLHGINARFQQAVVFCRDEAATVDTQPAANWHAFYHQRKRWSGKWQFYRDVPTQVLAVFVFLLNLAVVALPALAITGQVSWPAVANLVLMKLVFEYFYLREVQKFFKTKFLLHEFVILALGYPFYVILMAIAGFAGSYKWKGRTTR